MRSQFQTLVLEKSLHLIATNGNCFLDYVNPEDFPDVPEIQQVCAKISSRLNDQIDELCALLDIRKRRFIEAALIDAVAVADKIIDDEGVFDAIAPRDSTPSQGSK